MKQEIESQLKDGASRLRSKGLLVPGNDSLSMRVPGTNEYLLCGNADEQIETQSIDLDTPHAIVYRSRPDAGAVLIGTTKWLTAVAAIGSSPPVMYDEQARHIGAIPGLVRAGDSAGLRQAIETGSNIVFYGNQCVRIGITRDRVVFNSELFEKVRDGVRRCT